MADKKKNKKSKKTPKEIVEVQNDKPRKTKADGTWGQYPKSISRIETLKHSAWYVRIFYQGAYVRKTFSDTIYGSKDNALVEALAWRDEMEKAMGKPRTDRSVRKKNLAEDEYAGIHRRTLNAKNREGKEYERDVYEITWSPTPGKVSRTTISVARHGAEKALEMAKEIRREKEREVFGTAII